MNLQDNNTRENTSSSSKWGKFRSSKWLKRLTNPFVVTTIIFTLLIVFFNDHSLIRLISNWIDVSRQEEIILNYEKKIDEVDERIIELRTNIDSVERYARENYYFHTKDEDVFIVE